MEIFRLTSNSTMLFHSSTSLVSHSRPICGHVRAHMNVKSCWHVNAPEIIAVWLFDWRMGIFYGRRQVSVGLSTEHFIIDFRLCPENFVINDYDRLPCFKHVHLHTCTAEAGYSLRIIIWVIVCDMRRLVCLYSNEGKFRKHRLWNKYVDNGR